MYWVVEVVATVEVLQSCFSFLKKVREFKEPSILEVGNALGWNYTKARNVARALEEAGLIRLELYQGMPRKFVVRLTERGECITSCIS